MNAQTSVEAAIAVSANPVGLPVAKGKKHCIECGTPTTRGSGARCRKCCYIPRKRLMPDDFVEVAPTMSSEALSRHYRCSTAKITEWFAECGMSRTNQTRFAAAGDAPANLAEMARSHSLYQLKALYGRGECVIKRWLAEAGVQPRRYVTTFVGRGNRIPSHIVNRDISIAGRAADFLRKYGPVYPCNERGGAEPKGSHWSRGGFVLTDAEIIERAERLGWQADEWRRLVA